MQNVMGTWIYKPSQTELLLKHFAQVSKRITPLEANKVYGIERLSGRIYDLKKMGHWFSTSFKKDALGKRYAEYRWMGNDRDGLH